MMTPEQRAEAAEHRSNQYRALLNHPLLVEAVAALRDENIAAWRETGVLDTCAREDAWHALRAVDRLMRYLSQQAEDGAVQVHNMRAALDAAARRRL